MAAAFAHRIAIQQPAIDNTRSFGHGRSTVADLEAMNQGLVDLERGKEPAIAGLRQIQVVGRGVDHPGIVHRTNRRSVAAVHVDAGHRQRGHGRRDLRPVQRGAVHGCQRRIDRSGSVGYQLGEWRIVRFGLGQREQFRTLLIGALGITGGLGFEPGVNPTVESIAGIKRIQTGEVVAGNQVNACTDAP